MIRDYDVLYIDKEGDKQDFVVTAIDTNTAIANTLELCPELSAAQCLTVNSFNYFGVLSADFYNVITLVKW